MLLEIFTTIIDTEKMPDEWKHSTLIFKVFKREGISRV